MTSPGSTAGPISVTTAWLVTDGQYGVRLGLWNQTTPGTNPFSIPDWGHLVKVLSLLVLEARTVNLTLKQPQIVSDR